MKNRNSLANIIYTILFLVVIVILVSYIFLTTEPVYMHYKDRVLDYSGGWTMDDGTVSNVVDIRSQDYKRPISFQKKLPGNIPDDYCICFESRNAAKITVWLDDHQIYGYETKENLTGLGYGVQFHEIDLDASGSGHIVRFDVDGIYDRYGYVYNIYLCPAADYIHMNILSRAFMAIISLAIVFLGLMMIMVYLSIPDKENMPFNILALGFVAVLIGIWMLVDTNIMQLLTGYVYLWRAIDRPLIVMAVYPVVCFINSITKLKRPVYMHIAFWFSTAALAVMIGLRLFAGVDMADSFPFALGAIALVTVIMLIVIMVDNRRYCRANGITTDVRRFYVSALVFLVSMFADVTIYAADLFSRDGYGIFTRLGLIFFITVSMFQFLNWWTRDRVDIERDRLINRALQYAISSGYSEDGMRSLLDYMGKELNATRICIFEDQGDGRYRGTYEWFRPGLRSIGLDMIYLKYDEYIDDLYKAYNANGKKLIIRDPEEYRSIHPRFYNLMKTNNINTMVINPLESDGRINGLLTFINSPADVLEDTAEVMSLLSYFVSQLIRQREEQKRLKYFSYNDPVSGALNRSAFTEYIKHELDESSPFGYLTCRIGASDDSDAYLGYDEVDRLSAELADCMQEVFGAENVYCLAGMEFAAFGFETDETYFESDVQRLRNLAENRSIPVMIGSVYCTYGTMSITKVMKQAHRNLRREKG